MRASQPCDLCGCAEVNLHDGFYFCAECGTQDTNFQETIIEIVEAGGEILHGQKRKVVKIVEEEKEMSDQWYKWHAFNFLLKGVADELMEYGANPSFKTKLMWVWTRYIKKYLKKDEMGFNANPHKYTAPEEDDSDSDQDQPPEDLLTVRDRNREQVIKSFSFTLLVTLIYIALNLDKSFMTLTHVIKLFRDGLLSAPYRVQNIIPKEMKPEKLRFKIKRGLANFKSARIRLIAMTLFKRLDLGNPVVPDLRLIIDDYLKELCLPTDLKPLVLSLMHYKPCRFLDVNSKDKVVIKIPAYEFHVMTYIIWAMKLCLGLDCEYEVKLSTAAEAINEEEDRPRSYYVNGESAPTNRLFSFREWITFYQFRQILLRHHCYRYANKCSWDTDDYIALEHHIDLLHNVNSKDLKDEMAYELLHRIKGGNVESFVIPRSEFKPTLTPFYSYTQVLAQHLQDPELKMKLTEDFTQYSLKYAVEDWNLVNPKSKKKKNLVKGIRVKNKVVTNETKYYSRRTYYNKRMVYVKNCENHNWLTTKPPTMAHLVKVDKLQESEDLDILDDNQNNVEKATNNTDSEMKELQNGVDSKCNSISEMSLTNSTVSNSIQFMDETNILESNKLDATEKSKLRFNDSIASNAKFPDIISEKSFTDSTFSSSIQYLDDTKVFESAKLDDIEKEKLRQMHDKMSNPKEIMEETEGVNIFDDDFKPVIKEEIGEHCGMDYETPTDNFQDVPTGINQTENSCGSSIDSVLTFNEANFDRANAIREIILYTCKKHKLPIPAEYSLKDRARKEMGIFSRRIDNIANRIYTVRRNITHEKQRRGVWQGYVTDYQAALKDDFLNQIAQKVNLAVQNANSVQENEAPPLNDTVTVENINDDTMEVDALSNHSDIDLNDTNVTEHDSNMRSRIRYESDEDRLFSEESDGETHAKELLPEKNPDYDEEVYDASQLYVKAATTTDAGEIELDPQLSCIIDKKMVKDAKDPSLLKWTEERKKLARPDSEDEMPLSVLQELQKLRKKLSIQENEQLEPFLNKKVENFQYWLRCYIYSTNSLCRVFEKEICNELPKSFTFLIRQCAHILGVPEGDLYRNLQNFETTAVEKSRLKFKRVDCSYDYKQY